MVFFYLSKLLFSGYIQVKGNFVRAGYSNSNYRHWAPWSKRKRYLSVSNLL